MDKPKKVSIIMPAYNEEKTIKQVLDIVKKVNLKPLGLKKEIVVVNDCSTDRTESIVKKIKSIKLISHVKNKGKGGAVRTGFKHATGDIFLIQDADMEYDPFEYPQILKPIVEGKAKVVYGSRFLSRKQKKKNIDFVKHEKAYRLAYLGGRSITQATNILFGSRLTDEPTCYKVFRADVIRKMKIRGTKFEWEPEVTAKILKKGIKIHEVPISYYPRTFEEGKKINWKDGVQAIWTLIKYRFMN